MHSHQGQIFSNFTNQLQICFLSYFCWTVLKVWLFILLSQELLNLLKKKALIVGAVQLWIHLGLRPLSVGRDKNCGKNNFSTNNWVVCHTIAKLSVTSDCIWIHDLKIMDLMCYYSLESNHWWSCGGQTLYFYEDRLTLNPCWEYDCSSVTFAVFPQRT